MSAGGIHTCGVTTAGVAYCWGLNNHGQVGDGTTTQREVPTLIMAGLSVVQMSAGHVYSCGVSASHVAYCWGQNFDGQLGDGTTTRRNTPTHVRGL